MHSSHGHERYLLYHLYNYHKLRIHRKALSDIRGAPNFPSGHQQLFLHYAPLPAQQMIFPEQIPSWYFSYTSQTVKDRIDTARRYQAKPAVISKLLQT
ncbi:hypothetical protein D3C73_997580 [compost metagenome]